MILSVKAVSLKDVIVDAIEYLWEIFGLLYNSFKNLPYLRISPVLTVFLRQIYFAGIETFGKMVIIGLLAGIVIIAQITNLTGVGSAVLTGKILIWVMVRELGPLLAAVIIITRSVTAISAELGAMNVEGEIESIEMMGIDPYRYLIMPRVFAVSLSSVVLTFYFEFAAIFGGITVTSIFWSVPFEEYTKGIFSSLSFKEVTASFIKSLLFGMTIAAVSCSQGLKVSKSITQIPQATTRATIQSLFLVIIFDGIITFMFFVC
ncbi:MAG: ABC transporter permease [Nitrospirae bacterium]|nr:ABC transporter permease [Nitrospirota bacterium]